MVGKSAAVKYSFFGKVEFIKQIKPCRGNTTSPEFDLNATFRMVQINFLHTKLVIQEDARVQSRTYTCLNLRKFMPWSFRTKALGIGFWVRVKWSWSFIGKSIRDLFSKLFNHGSFYQGFVNRSVIVQVPGWHWPFASTPGLSDGHSISSLE